MNLTNFLKQTDAITAQYSAGQLSSFIHEIGRILPEPHREDFLERLKAAGSNATKAPQEESAAPAEFEKMYKLVKENLKRIDSQEITLESKLNEEYDDWYNSGVDEFFYMDSKGISEMLEQACSFVHTCMDIERYQEGFKIGYQLFSMEILCESEYGDEEFSIEDMALHDFLESDLIQVALDTAYCAYHAVTLKKRPESLYRVIENSKKNEIMLETIMQHGDDELPDFQDFLPLWIAYLGEKTDRTAERLILEAVSLLNDLTLETRYAEQYASVHPGLYLNILKNTEFKNAHSLIELGMEAINRIPKKYMIRSEIALKTAECMLKAGMKPHMVQKCYFAAYESDTSAVNYLRVLLNGYGTTEKKETLSRVFRAFDTGKSTASYGIYSGGSSHSEREENRPDRNMIFMLRFLNGQFDEVLSDGLGHSQSLGWTGTFMKQGIALYLLTLNNGPWFMEGLIRMEEIVRTAMNFSAEQYRSGTDESVEQSDKEVFHKVFLMWKAVEPMAPKVRERAIKRITNLLEKRTEAIIAANRTNYYRECAAYIAALGEVRESLGEPGAKQRLLSSYKDKYSRRSAFRAALRDYGWIDVKKK